MRYIFRNMLFLSGFILFVAIAPFILAKSGFWQTSHAATAVTTEASRLTAARMSFNEAVERASPAVVSIMPTKELPIEAHPLMRDPHFRQFFGDPRQIPPQKIPSIGSGVIVHKQGYILTNNHVISDADAIKVKLLDGRESDAEIVGVDPESDLAILKVDMKDLPIIEMGDSDTLKIGDVVLAIGNPFGVGQTVTQGIISATQRSNLGLSTFENFLQTDAAINPGNSGGALIDSQGQLIGINNAIFTRSGGYQGIGFAIPVGLAKDVMDELIEHGHVTRGWLGVTVRRLNDEIRKSLDYKGDEGVVIAGVIRNGPAFNAGIRPGDVLISVNEETTKHPRDVLSVTSKLTPEKAYPISIHRDGQIHDYRVIVGKRPVKSLEKPAPNERQPSHEKRSRR